MRPGRYTLRIIQGATDDRVITLYADEAQTTPVDLTGSEARLQIRKAKSLSEVLLDLNSTDGQLVLGGVAGTITFNVTPADTDGLDWTKAVYDLEVESSGGQVIRWLEGDALLDRNVTREPPP